MPFIAANGFLILVPAAFYLESKASSEAFDIRFCRVQGVELIAGAANLVMMGMNIRDGLMMTGHVNVQKQRTTSKPDNFSIKEREAGPLIAKNLSLLTDANNHRLDIKPVVVLCRCGASKNKPYCDGTHYDIR